MRPPNFASVPFNDNVTASISTLSSIASPLSSSSPAVAGNMALYSSVASAAVYAFTPLASPSSYQYTATAASMALATAMASIPSIQTGDKLATSTSSTNPNDPDPPNGECELLGPFAIIVQAALGLLALLSLVYKRWRERPQRPVKIWAFDASKQVFGSALLHLVNLVMSMFSAGKIDVSTASAAAVVEANAYTPNPCSFYLLNLAIDTTVGIPILIVLLRIITHVARMLSSNPESIESGHYGSPPRWSWWLKQSMLYFLGLLGMKVCVLFIFQVLPWISEVGDWALRWTEGNEALQIIFVMLLFPVIMNALQYYIVDSFIKRKNSEHEIIGDGEGDGDDQDGERDGLMSGEQSDDDEDVDRLDLSDTEVPRDDAQKRKGLGTRTHSSKSKRSTISVLSKDSEATKIATKEYDPDKDGESSQPTSRGGQ